MHERIKQLRKELGLKQSEFGAKIGVVASSVGRMERGDIRITDKSLKIIVNEFNVNEEWLRTGQGEMFIPEDRFSEISKLTKQLLDEEDNSFKNRFISMLANLSVDEWELLENKVRELAGK